MILSPQPLALSPSASSRRAYIDWARGLAVLVMIQAHTFDSWTADPWRHSITWRNAVIVAGFAAPLFLWLAGVAVVMAATRAAQRTGSRVQATTAIVRRGLEIFLLAFLFRIQAFVLSPGSPLLTIFRVDILNVMGPAIAVAGLVWGAARTSRQRAAVFAVLAAGISAVTPLVGSMAAIDALPSWMQWNLRWSGEYSTFFAFPWVGFVFAGCATGALIAAAADESGERALHAALALTGAALVVVGVYTAGRPSIYRDSTFWHSSPTWFAIRIGIMTTALAALGALEGSSVHLTVGRWLAPLARLGRSSLFVYWIHVELVYGYASYYWWKSLPLRWTVVAYALFCVAMYGAVVLRDRLVHWWRQRGSAESYRARQLTTT